MRHVKVNLSFWLRSGIFEPK